jgi:hypothetical protein
MPDNNSYNPNIPYKHSFGEMIFKLWLNVILLVLLAITLVSRAFDFIFLKPISFFVDREIVNPITVLICKLVHFILIPASAFKGITSKTNETPSFIKRDSSQLFVTLGGNGEFIESVNQVCTLYYVLGISYKQLNLSHSDPELSSAISAADLVNHYTKKIGDELGDAKKLCLAGRSMGGAILALVLQNIIEKNEKKEKPFDQLKEFEIVIDRSFETLSKVCNSRGHFGYLPVASIILPLLGWEIDTKAAIEASEKKLGSNLKVIVQSCAEDDLLGSGKLGKASLRSCNIIHLEKQILHNDARSQINSNDFPVPDDVLPRKINGRP